MLNVKQAAMNAADYLTNLYAEQLPGDIQLEEVELSEDEQHWLITMSFLPRSSPTTFSQMLRTPNRSYKVFKIDAQTGEMVSMKIRTVEAA